MSNSIILIDNDIASDAISLEYVKSQYREGSDNIVLVINSAGGSVREGLLIHNWLQEKRKEGKNITSLILNAYSIATIVALASDYRIIHPEGNFMIHYPRYPFGSVGGTAEDLREYATKLDVKGNILLNYYNDRTGLGTMQLGKLMSKEYIMDSWTAYELGFAHTVAKFSDYLSELAKPKVSEYEVEWVEPINFKQEPMIEKLQAVIDDAIKALKADPTVDVRLFKVNGDVVETDSVNPEIKIGDEVKAQGEKVENGEHKLANGTTVITENGKVVDKVKEEIKEPEVEKPKPEVKVEAEVKEEVKEEEVEAVAQHSEGLEERFNSFVERFNQLMESVIPVLAKGEEVKELQDEIAKIKGNISSKHIPEQVAKVESKGLKTPKSFAEMANKK